MEIIVAYREKNIAIQEFFDYLRELNLNRFASDAAMEMEFSSGKELDEALQRSIEICRNSGLDVDANFKRIYVCTGDGIIYDWKLSALGYELVCLNGSPSNKNVAQKQTNLLVGLD